MKKLIWYILAACIWTIVFPVTAITAWAFMISGPLVVVAIILKVILIVLGIDATWIRTSSFSFGTFPDLIIALSLGLVLAILGFLLWKLTKKIYRWLDALNPSNYQKQAGE